MNVKLNIPLTNSKVTAFTARKQRKYRSYLAEYRIGIGDNPDTLFTKGYREASRLCKFLAEKTQEPVTFANTRTKDGFWLVDPNCPNPKPTYCKYPFTF